MYDAVMTIGIGTCQALQDKEEKATGIVGDEHLQGIRSVDFLGASGPIRSGGTNDSYPGSRVGSTIPFTATNFVAINGSTRYVRFILCIFCASYTIRSSIIIQIFFSRRIRLRSNIIPKYQQGYPIALSAVLTPVQANGWKYCQSFLPMTFPENPSFYEMNPIITTLL